VRFIFFSRTLESSSIDVKLLFRANVSNAQLRFRLFLSNASVKQLFFSAESSIFFCVGLSKFRSLPAIDLFYTRARAATLEGF